RLTSALAPARLSRDPLGLIPPPLSLRRSSDSFLFRSGEVGRKTGGKGNRKEDWATDAVSRL
ncbi:MAG: hypothetical protein WCT34_05250, partial [Patescibacteria group bacterium]